MSSSLSHLLSRLSQDPGKRGRQFEDLCRWFLQSDPTYKAIVARVWLWDDWPGRWAKDAGIDLVAETKDGDLWAIQSKCVDAQHWVKKEEIDSFLSESSRSVFSFRLLIATTDHVGSTARRTIEDQEKPVHLLLRSALEAADPDWPASPEDLRPLRPPPKEPFPHNQEAVEAILKGLRGTDRGQVIMACGTGKTLVSLWSAEALGAERTLVLVPSLSLLAQTIREWTRNASSEFPFLPVCSDDTVADDDALVGRTSDLGYPVTTDPGRIADFQAGSGRRVIFSTYQSSPKIAEALALGAPGFDLTIADEAHRCAGAPGEGFSTILDDRLIRSNHRLFFTATPRFLSQRVKNAGEGADLRLVSMDDTTVFGPVLHRLSFGEAISKGLLADYQVVVVAVDHPTYARYVEQGTLVRATTPDRTTDARTLATQIAVLKKIRTFDLTRVLTFHGRVRLAQRFVSGLESACDLLPDGEAPSQPVWAAHVSGAMPSGERDRLIRQFREVNQGRINLLANVRCLAEGVDVPSIDGLAFIDPRTSHVDIVQAVGRVLRRSPGKVRGTVLVPVFIDPGDDPVEAISSSPFTAVWSVLLALRAHDESLADELDGIRRNIGRHGGRGAVPLPGKVRLDVPTTVGMDFGEAFSLRLVERTTRAWEFWYGLLVRYVEENGTLDGLRPKLYEGHDLGGWMNQQRMIYNNAQPEPDGSRRHPKFGSLSADRISQLESIKGWQWSPMTDYFEKGFASLVSYVAAGGSPNVHSRLKLPDFPLGRWVNWIRTAYRNGSLSSDRVQRFEAIKGWTWDPYGDVWNNAYSILRAYVARGGNPDVRSNFVEADFKLGEWIYKQREHRARNRLSEERLRRLEAIKGWRWSSAAKVEKPKLSASQQRRSDELWSAALERLQKYQLIHGNCDVSVKYIDTDGFGLGNWISLQRKYHKKGILLPERQKRLEAIDDWVWGAHDEAWERAFKLLRQYLDREGTSRIPMNQIEDGVHLGRWVENQRKFYARGTLRDERREKLASLTLWKWRND